MYVAIVFNDRDITAYSVVRATKEETISAALVYKEHYHPHGKVHVGELTEEVVPTESYTLKAIK